jgi:hypothetical protein
MCPGLRINAGCEVKLVKLLFMASKFPSIAVPKDRSGLAYGSAYAHILFFSKSTHSVC